MSQLSDPSSDFFAITPHDTNDLASITRGIYVGGAGDLVVEEQNGEQITFTGVVAGSVYPFRVRKVLATGTTATALVALL